MRRITLVGIALAAILARGTPASASSVRDEPYSFETTWNAAVRMVRVDLGCPITERDQETGYFTFTYREGGRSVPGSIEIVRTDVDGRSGARVIVQIPEMPTYVESMLLTRLGRKLHTEFGEPPPAPHRPNPNAPPVDTIHPDESPDAGAPTQPTAPPTTPPAAPPAERAPQNSSHATPRHAPETC